jgi:4-hydroxy-tetrahydrodipicolinate synthase
MSISGTIVPMATPIAGRNGRVDEAALRSYAGRLVDGGVQGLFPCGSIGEFSSLTDDQRRRTFEAVVDAADGVSVFAGCGDTSVEAVQSHVRNAAAAGADGAVVVTPYYLSTTQDGLAEFYVTVADDAELPLVLYNIPALTGHSLSVETVVRLAAHDAIVGLKDTTGNLGYHRNLVAETPDDFDVLQGATELAVASLDVGSDGLVAGPANVFPEAVADVYASHVAGDRDRAVRLMNAVVHPTVRATDELPTAAAIKHLVGCAGCDIGGPMPPLPTLTESQKRTLERTYRRIAET